MHKYFKQKPLYYWHRVSDWRHR